MELFFQGYEETEGKWMYGGGRWGVVFMGGGRYIL